MPDESNESSYRIGEVAERVGVTTRTIRYYEELGLIAARAGRTKGSHRVYREADVARLQELIRARDLLGVSLEELKCLLDAQGTEAILRDRWQRAGHAGERRAILRQSLENVDAQLALVCARHQALGRLEQQLGKRRRRIRDRLRGLERESGNSAG